MKIFKLPRKLIRLFASFALLFVFLGYASAWHSFPVRPFSKNVHRPIANAAINALRSAEPVPSNPTEYPDVYKFTEALRDGSESETPHVNGKYNGGDVTTWWNRNVLQVYKRFNFPEAYIGIGQIGHLTQDQAVPAHAANIYHPYYAHTDQFEAAADWHYEDYPGIESGDLSPDEYYQPLQASTRMQLSDWLKPGTTVPYWLPSPNAPPIDSDSTAFLTNNNYWGSYGDGGDSYLMFKSGSESSSYGAGGDTYIWTDHPEILASRLFEATKYSVGVFAAASKKLPALVKDFQIYPSTISKTNPATISFHVLENRMPDVKITLMVDGKESQAVKSADDKIFFGRDEELGPGVDLSWEKTLAVAWDGKLADDSYIPDGNHTLTIEVLDHDKNDPDPKSVEFKSDYHPPVLRLGDLFTDWEGVSTNIAHTLVTSHNLTINDAGSGIKTVLITGPGVAVDETFETPSTDPYNYNLENLADGTYTITTTDALGQETMVQFAVGLLSIYINLDKSSSTYSAASDNFSVSIAADMVATFGFDRREFMSPASTNTRTVFESTSASELFDLTEPFKGYNFNPPAGATHTVTYDYTLRVGDKAGNSRIQGFHVSYDFTWNGSLLLGGESVRTTPVLDLRDSGILNGVILPAGSRLSALNSRLFPPLAQTNLDLSAKAGNFEVRSYLGKVEVYVKTSDRPDLSDAEYVLAGTRYLTGSQEFPDEFGNANYQVSYVDSPNSDIKLERYYQVKASTGPSLSDENLHLCILFCLV